MASRQLALTLLLMAVCIGLFCVAYGAVEMHKSLELQKATQETCLVVHAGATFSCTEDCPDNPTGEKCYGSEYKYSLTAVGGACAGANFSWASQDCDLDGPRYVEGHSYSCYVMNDCSKADMLSPTFHKTTAIILLAVGGTCLGPLVLGCIGFCIFFVYDTCTRRRQSRYASY